MDAPKGQPCSVQPGRLSGDVALLHGQAHVILVVAPPHHPTKAHEPPITLGAD